MKRFSAFYLICFIAVGAYASWLAPFLDSCGVTASSIGYSFAVVSLLRAVTPPAWGFLADRLARPQWLLAFVTLGSGLCLMPLFLGGPVPLLLVCTVAFGVFFAPLYPLVDAQVVGFLGAERQRYGRVRLFGSLGFLIASFAVGSLVDATSLNAIPWVVTLPFGLAAMIALTFPSAGASSAPPTRARFPWKRLWPVLVAVALVQASHAPYWAYFAITLGKQGVSGERTGWILATAVAAEIAFMGFTPAVLHRLGARPVLLVGLLAGALRWALCGLVEELSVLWLSQLLHAGSYAMVYVAAVALVDDESPVGQKALGQTVLSACSHGIGLGGGFALSGQFFDVLGFAGLALCGAAACLLASVLLLVAQPRYPRGEPLAAS